MRLKPIAPKPYNGDADDTVFYMFLVECNNYMRQSGLDKYPRQQVERMPSFLTDKASKFYMQFVGDSPHTWTLDRFFVKLMEYCFPPDYRQRQRTRFTKLKQGDKSIIDFHHEIELLSTLLGDVSERERVQRLWYGVKPDYKEQLHLKELNSEYSTYKKVLSTLLAIEASRISAYGSTEVTRTQRNNGNGQSATKKSKSGNGVNGYGNDAGRGQSASSGPKPSSGAGNAGKIGRAHV